jgi:hypothetical protein
MPDREPARPTPNSPAIRRRSCCSSLRVAATDAAPQVAVPQQNFVGVVIDDSRSMKVADQDGKAAWRLRQRSGGRTDGPMLTQLGKRFNLKIARFSARPSVCSRRMIPRRRHRTRMGDAPIACATS